MGAKMIKITAEKVIVRGERHIKVTEIEAMSYQELPSAYTAKDGSVWKEGKWLAVKHNDGFIGIAGKGYESMTYPEKQFNEKMETVRAAGKMLGEINAKLAEKNKDWHGTIEVLI